MGGIMDDRVPGVSVKYYQHKFLKILENHENFDTAREIFHKAINNDCYDAYEKVCAMKDRINAKLGLVALYMVNFMSLSAMDEFFADDNPIITEVHHEIVLYCCVLLNIANWKFLEWSSTKSSDVMYYTKQKIVKKFVKKQLKQQAENKRLVTFYCQCANELGILRKSNENGQKHSDICHDGRIYDRLKDPPGQCSVYIPPGETAKETYRLSTYIRFPQEVPINPRDLASAGFFYTGYKDRVKCFCCGLCIENWCLGDDVSASRWHRSDCNKMLGRECGNIAIVGLFQRINQANATIAKLPQTPSSCDSGNKDQQDNIPNGAAGLLLAKALPAIVSDRIQHQEQEQACTSSIQLHKRFELATTASVHHEHYIRSLDLTREIDRLKSFKDWPARQQMIRASKLAQSGFFYLGNLDRVQCFSCSGVLRNWKKNDDVDAEHRKHFPHCRMTSGSDVNNVQMSSEDRSAATQQPKASNQTGAYHTLSDSEKRGLMSMFQCLYPVNAHMSSENSRLETFDMRWPSNRVRATTLHIASAGFFFLGERDRVKCWYCNGGLQNWDLDDEPWTEHAKWFPTCEFLLQQKGPDFVHQIISRFPNLQRPVLRNSYDVIPQTSLAGQRPHHPAPPPPIIDPQKEIRLMKERINKHMNSTIVKHVMEMGFERPTIYRVVKRKIESGSEMYKSVSQLMEDVINESSTENSSLEDDSNESNSGMEMHFIAAQEMAVANCDANSKEIGGESSMEARIQELQEERKCKICLDRMADIVFVPCGHLCSCITCTQSLHICPICRAKIEKSIRTYMS